MPWPSRATSPQYTQRVCASLLAQCASSPSSIQICFSSPIRSSIRRCSSPPIRSCSCRGPASPFQICSPSNHPSSPAPHRHRRPRLLPVLLYLDLLFSVICIPTLPFDFLNGSGGVDRRQRPRLAAPCRDETWCQGVGSAGAKSAKSTGVMKSRAGGPNLLSSTTLPLPGAFLNAFGAIVRCCTCLKQVIVDTKRFIQWKIIVLVFHWQTRLTSPKLMLKNVRGKGIELDGMQCLKNRRMQLIRDNVNPIIKEKRYMDLELLIVMHANILTLPCRN
ncbi:uncharacterized protein LOC110431334 [Sorghum bicolor]|uniref:uncharacterized protein LOC110431334 n=1 Tax=Sorghum bicolor TaxID=4558 RepID=UPI000B424C20|nr:uncharacterized protein LOC110431334 [Sorghum bicolor]|eukprot:XP_021306041.1 uncharacterized protein LOC110431334 [Sorghum bicolor]